MSSLILFLMLISLVCNLDVGGGAAACEVREREALLELKEAVITKWPSWGRASDCCQWQGIKCHNVTGRVIQLKLIGFWQFDIPCSSNSTFQLSSIANLLHLQVLDVRHIGCLLQGTIPPHLGSLPNLVRLAIVNTFLSGPIPPQLGALPKLNYLHLSQNSLNGSIPPQLGSLRRLTYLDLSGNSLTATIPPQLGSLGRLTYLNLSYNWLEGTLFPSHLASLQNLVYLDLSYNYNLESSVFTDSVSWKSLGNLSRLEHLDISAPDFYSTQILIFSGGGGDPQYRPSWPCQWSSLRYFACSGIQLRFPAHSVPFCFDSFNNHLQYLDLSSTGLHSTSVAVTASLSNASNLRYLSLASNNFQSFPPCLLQLPLLETLDISYNDLRSRIPAALANLTALQNLDLSQNSLTGTVDWEPFANMTSSLQSVSLTGNMLTGPIPEAFSRCTILHLSHNYFSGSLPGFVGNNVILDIRYNNLSALPANLGNCTGLIYAGLGNNGFIGSIPASMGNCTQLKTLDLSNNLLTGCIPPSLGHIHDLSEVDLSSLGVYDFEGPSGGIFLNNNRLSGSIPTTLGCLGQGVQQLDISNNNLTGIIPTTLGCLGQSIQDLDISSNNLSGFIPSSLGNLTRLNSLDLSWNSLTSAGFPPCFQNTSIGSLTLSNNKLSGSLPSPLLISSGNFDLHSNFFEGAVPLLRVSKGNTVLDLSNNSFGTIPYHFCNLSNLMWLSLSANHLVGGIPDCFSESVENLQYLDFSNNGLSGSLPSSISNCTGLTVLKVGNNRLGKEIQSIGSLCQAQSESIGLQSLQLHNNNFTGMIPPALKKCTGIRLMDLSHNWFTGRIPRWIGKGQYMASLEILSLRNNHLEGSIPSALTNLSKLGILDLANNHLSGRIPEGLHRLQGMKNTSGEPNLDYLGTRYYEEEITISSKGLDMKLELNLAMYTCLDLSGNHLRGETPPEIGTLIGLLTLNLSHNMLGGPIPSTLGDVTALESLDLSSNHFNGTIPEELVHLTFLEVFNVSNNLLHGRIPQGGQFNTFNNASSFEGNPGLCGPPLPNPCSPPPPPAATTSDVPDQEHLSFLQKMEEHVSLAAVGIGFALGFLIVGYLFNFVIWKPNSRM